jgi:hypothetical protein
MRKTQEQREEDRVPSAIRACDGDEWPKEWVATHLIRGIPVQIKHPDAVQYRDHLYRAVYTKTNQGEFEAIPLETPIPVAWGKKRFARIPTEAAGAAIRAACWPDWEGTVGYSESSRGDSATVIGKTENHKIVRVAVKRADHCDYHDVLIPREWVLPLAEG